MPFKSEPLEALPWRFQLGFIFWWHFKNSTFVLRSSSWRDRPIGRVFCCVFFVRMDFGTNNIIPALGGFGESYDQSMLRFLNGEVPAETNFEYGWLFFFLFWRCDCELERGKCFSMKPEKEVPAERPVIVTSQLYSWLECVSTSYWLDSRLLPSHRRNLNSHPLPSAGSGI